MAKAHGKNKWALSLLIFAGLVLGSFIGYALKDVEFLKWLNYGFDFSLGNTKGDGVLGLNLGPLALYFGIRLKITVGSALGAVAAVLLFRKI